ncbi:hypothetical protein L3X38_006169 [Prunus dulcis]|uniref:Uncharacterized protein n=1 Tax=Prunus dulcis TaxID=3755 RepID=A0AAD4ZSA4_PRUDU|nr:hypothetical protein L3X38_006169 [Prunus dulcis]
MNQQFYDLGSVDYTKNVPYKTSLVEDFLRHEKVKKALGVNGSLVFEECNDLVRDILHEDVMKSEIHGEIFDEEEQGLDLPGEV